MNTVDKHLALKIIDCGLANLDHAGPTTWNDLEAAQRTVAAMRKALELDDLPPADGVPQ